jgi:hypothetical protein
LLTALTLLCARPLHSQETVPARQIFESHPQVAPLQCASTSAAAARPPAASTDRIPDANDIDAVIDATASSARSPALPPDLARAFALPAAGGRLRVGVWGDSHVAGGFITDELIKRIEAAGVGVDTREIPASLGRPGVRLPLKRVCKDGWQFQSSYGAQSTLQVGPSLANLRSTKAGDYVWLDLRQRPDRTVRTMRIHYLPMRGKAAIGVRVDDGSEVRFELEQSSADGAAAPGLVEVRASQSVSTLKLRVLQGDVVLQGFSVVYDEAAPMTIDVFGIPSATVKGWSNADLSYLKASLRPDAYDAIILEYGTNEGAVDRFDPSRYAALLGASLRSMRHVFPNAACVLMGPTDRGVRVSTHRAGKVDLLKYSRIHQQITRIQSDIGGDFGCVVWDWQRYMGGNGSIYRWARETPSLAAADLIHLTPLGYRRTAAALAQSLGWPAPQR